MSQDWNHKYIRPFFTANGFFVDRPPDATKGPDGRMSYPKKGRADFTVFKNDRSCAFETKTGEASPDWRNYPFDKWEPEQREWAKEFTLRGNKYFLFVTVGSRIQEKPTPKNPFPQISILVPMQEMLRLEIEYMPIRKSLPYKYFETSPYRCPWNKQGGYWDIPEESEFWAIWKS